MPGNPNERYLEVASSVDSSAASSLNSSSSIMLSGLRDEIGSSANSSSRVRAVSLVAQDGGARPAASLGFVSTVEQQRTKEKQKKEEEQRIEKKWEQFRADITASYKCWSCCHNDAEEQEKMKILDEKMREIFVRRMFKLVKNKGYLSEMVVKDAIMQLYSDKKLKNFMAVVDFLSKLHLFFCSSLAVFLPMKEEKLRQQEFIYKFYRWTEKVDVNDKSIFQSYNMYFYIVPPKTWETGFSFIKRVDKSDFSKKIEVYFKEEKRKDEGKHQLNASLLEEEEKDEGRYQLNLNLKDKEEHELRETIDKISPTVDSKILQNCVAETAPTVKTTPFILQDEFAKLIGFIIQRDRTMIVSPKLQKLIKAEKETATVNVAKSDSPFCAIM